MQPGDSDREGSWADGRAYVAYVGRWSRPVAAAFLDWLKVPPGSAWLDVGCGTGALSSTVLRTARPGGVTGLDRSERFLAFARAQIPDARALFAVGDAGALPLRDAALDAAVSGFALNFFPDPGAALSEQARVVRPGGVVAAYVWDYAGKMQLMRHFWNAAAALDSRAEELDEGRRFPLCAPEPLTQLWRAAGLREVEARGIEVATDFRDFEDYWSPFLGGQGPAPGYVASLSEERRAELRERLRAALPAALDGSIPLTARAWAVKGLRG